MGAASASYRKHPIVNPRLFLVSCFEMGQLYRSVYGKAKTYCTDTVHTDCWESKNPSKPFSSKQQKDR